jgi:uncharacterized protein YjbI with pentapeptide repeats
VSTLLELLQAGQVEEFNARRGQRVVIDLFAADLSGLSLADVDLSNANLEKADLTDCDLTGANLSKANLSGADLTGARLESVVAVKTRFREAYLGKAKAPDAEFAGADFTEADLTCLTAPRARFGGARFKDAVLANAVLPETDLSEARLAAADLRGTVLVGAVLARAELGRADLSGADLTRAVLHAARMGGAVLKGAVLRDADLAGADLSSADLTGATLSNANLERADLYEAQLDDGALRDVRGATPAPSAEAEPSEQADLHIEDPSVALRGPRTAIIWENADDDDTCTLRVASSPGTRAFDGRSHAIHVPVEQVMARAVLPGPGDGFTVVVFADRPSGVELLVYPLDAAGQLGAPASCRMGYVPVVKPIVVPDENDAGYGFLIYGIGRNGSLSVHRWDGTALTERLRAPANTYRGFCGKSDPVLLGKGGTIVVVRPDGLGRLLTAPASYPGRLTAAAARPDGDHVALLWSQKGERGLRFEAVGSGESVRLDVDHEIGTLDLVAHGERWLAIWTREAATERETTLPHAAWLPGGKPFPLLPARESLDVEELRFVPGGARPCVALVTLAEECHVFEIGESDARRVGWIGG